MKLLPLAGAAALCAALLLTACAKKTDQSSSTSTTDTTTTQSGAATPAAGAAATTAPAGEAATPAAATSTAGTSVTTSTGNGTSSGYIAIPVYPGASENKDQEMTASGNGTSVTMAVYTTKDDAKTVSEWYKAHLPGSWKSSIITFGGKTGGTFVDEHTDGDQSVLVATQDATTTRIQATTKHGK